MVAREYGSASSSSPSGECVDERQEEAFREGPVHVQEQREVPSATINSSRDKAAGNSAVDAFPRHTTTGAPACNQVPERGSDENSVGCGGNASSGERRTAPTAAPEPTPATYLCREAVLEPKPDSDACRIVDEQTNSSGCTELGAQAAEALLLSEFSKDGAMMVGETDNDEGIGVEDWLDLTYAMLDTNVLEPDLD